MRGQYHQLLSTTLTASPGSILLGEPSRTPITNSTVSDSFSKQFRDVRSMDNREPDTVCQSTDVEAPYNDGRDRAFSLLLEMEGDGAILAYRIATDATPETTEGKVMIPESGFHELPLAECPEYIPGPLPSFILNDSPLADAFTPYISTFPDNQYIAWANPCPPEFSPPPGSYGSPQSVSITCSSYGVTIYYTTDGSIPSPTNGAIYSSPVTIGSGTVTLSAIAYNAGGFSSSVTIGTYIITTIVPSLKLDTSGLDALVLNLQNNAQGITNEYTDYGGNGLKESGIGLAGVALWQVTGGTARTLLYFLEFETDEGVIDLTAYLPSEPSSLFFDVIIMVGNGDYALEYPVTNIIESQSGGITNSTFNNMDLGGGGYTFTELRRRSDNHLVSVENNFPGVIIPSYPAQLQVSLANSLPLPP
jgi:hypothetical protein